MKTSVWRRWCNSLFSAAPVGPVSRARPRRLGLHALEDRVTPALTPQMVFDINATTLSSNPTHVVVVGQSAFFAADDGVHGVALWKSDGTAAGTVMVKDVQPANLTDVNGTLFFTIDNGIHSWGELWKSDGTATGTVRVSSVDASATYLTNVNGTLFFAAHESETGWELWKSDGTAAGTVLVKDINPSWSSSNPRNLTNVNGTLFFTVSDYYGTIAPGLWKSDGTAAGTVLVKPLYQEYQGSGGHLPQALTNANGTLFFRGFEPATGWELWKSDGTATGTVVVEDIYAGVYSSLPGDLTNVNGTLYFTADDGVHGIELWKSDGTAAGTTLVKDIYASYPGASPRDLTTVNGTLFFAADDGTHGRELWKTDGTPAGTVLVKDTSTNSVGAGPYHLTNVNGTLFFTVSDSNVNGTPSFSTSTELWKSDGTTAGTVLVKNINAGSAYPTLSSLANVNGTLLFAASDALHGRELWKSDGTAAGTALVEDIHTHTSGGNPGPKTEVNGTLFFAADDGVHGTELWKSDGTAAGTTLVKDIAPGGGWIGNWYYGYFYQANSSSPSQLTNVNGTLFFTASGSGAAGGLWKSDGTAAGTARVAQMGAGNLTNVNGTLFFTASDGTNGTELWKSDGTAAGTVLVKDIYPGSSYYSHPYGGGWWYPNSSAPAELTNVNGTLFFTANDEAHGRELWKSDGTAAGTVLVQDIRPGTYGPGPGPMTELNGTLFFAAGDGATGRELWKSDGTAAGTVLVKDIRSGSSGSYSGDLANVNGTLFFSAGDGTTGRELWKSDGTAAGTSLVKDINPGTAGSEPRSFTSVNGTVYFTAYDGTHGWELWKTDGTAAGTTLVKDIDPGSGNSSPAQLTGVDGTLYFTAYSASSWPRLWQSDGSAAGTVLVADLRTNSLVNLNGTLFFYADDGVHGMELWTLAAGATLEMTGLPAAVAAGTAGTVTVTVRNPDGSIDTDYRGTVRFTSTDPQAVLPADYTFTAADQGVHTFTVTLKTAGSQSVTVGDPALPGVAGTQAATVTPAAASTLTAAGFPSSVTAGLAWNITVTAWDAYGNRATGYTGTVRFTSSDPQAALPGNYTFTAADAGRRTFSATLKTAGSQSLTVTDTASGALVGTQTGIQVNPAAARRFLLVAPPSVTAGASFSLTVKAVDAYGNLVPLYRGRVSFKSSDSTANLPRPYRFTAADQGVHTFTGLKLSRRGTQTITVTDTTNSLVTASLSITVL